MSPRARSDRRPGKRHMVIADATNYMYRAYFALPPMRSPGGEPVQAALGFTNMVRKILRDETPDAFVAVFDAPGGDATRRALYPDYKAQRDKQPEDLSPQFAAARDLAAAHGLAVLKVPGCEADDVIATLAATAGAAWRITILSTDKDLMQLVDERVVLLDTMKNRRYDSAAVTERFGVPPHQVLDLRSLVGDPSDNIPGVRGIGAVGGAQLIRDWGSLEALLEHADEVRPPRARTALREQAEAARLSKRLAALREDIDLGSDITALTLREIDRDGLRALFARYGFRRLLEELQDEGGDAPPVRANPTPVAWEILTDPAQLAPRLAYGEPLCILPVGGGRNAHDALPVGFGLATDAQHALYLPVDTAAGGEEDNYEAVLLALYQALRGSRWGGIDTKALQGFLHEGLIGEGYLREPRFALNPPAFDVEIAAFLLDPAARRGVPALAAQRLGRAVPTWQNLAGNGAKAIPPAELSRESVADWAAQHCGAILELAPQLEAELERAGSAELYRDIELPLTAVLARMETAGVRVDGEGLATLAHQTQRDLVAIETEVHELAGHPFQINSPKQLQVVLFEELQLPALRKTKTGYSTDEHVLEQLASRHPLPKRVLAYRKLAKLKNTYIDALPPLIDPTSGRIHPCFHQTGAATGRISSSHPNVQNIPIRSERGRLIRETFIAGKGLVLLSADYSQIELRILAHFSQDESLLEAFRAGEDVHRHTAASIHGLDPEQVSDTQRARAKAINFGIIYGSTAFGIANQLGIASADAQETIDAYFERYRGVRRFLDDTVREAGERGYVTTLLGRRRYLPDLRSRNRVQRQAAERMAVNTVVQGTAADLIKRAMVEIDRELRRVDHDAELLMQVHDELVFELHPSATASLGVIVTRHMEGAAQLDVPLRVEIGSGRSWRDAH